MKILLTTLDSGCSHSDLAIRSLYAAGVINCPDLHVREYNADNDEEYIYMDLLRGDYDVIFFSTYIRNIETIKYLCTNLKKARPSLRLIAGGSEVSTGCRKFLEDNPSFDAAIYGEGEYTFSLVCRALKKGSPLFSNIPGLAYRTEKGIEVNKPMPPLKFDSLPFPYSVLPAEDDKIIYYESSRGCPYKCSYCISSPEKTVRALPIERVKTELAYFMYKEVSQVKFTDRTFNWDRDRALEILKYLVMMDNGKTVFRFELAGDLIDERLIDLVETSREGMFSFKIGIQSTNLLTLKAVNKKSNLKQCLTNVQKLVDTGKAHVDTDLIVGLPFEGYDSVRMSFNNIYSAGADMIRVGFLKLLKGTAIRFNEKFYEYVYRDRAPYEVISNGFISAVEIAHLKQLENVLDLFYNKGGFEETLNFLITNTDMTPFDFYIELSDFFYLKGYHRRSHSKEDLYRIMYEYIQWKARHAGFNTGDAEYNLIGDLENSFDEDAVKKFKKKGWELPEERVWQENIRI